MQILTTDTQIDQYTITLSGKELAQVAISCVDRLITDKKTMFMYIMSIKLCPDKEKLEQFHKELIDRIAPTLSEEFKKKFNPSLGFQLMSIYISKQKGW